MHTAGLGSIPHIPPSQGSQQNPPAVLLVVVGDTCRDVHAKHRDVILREAVRNVEASHLLPDQHPIQILCLKHICRSALAQCTLQETCLRKRRVFKDSL